MTSYTANPNHNKPIWYITLQINKTVKKESIIKDNVSIMYASNLDLIVTDIVTDTDCPI